ncbi:TonB-dependent receptor plug domain-containing protein [Thalassolituus sp. LLYu03]|uniref:TonB-dependent receptor plug domain-containing protein n=1 Tax=Thalassolituus sp. LLYu03 TaxID=3421656 RepID=UPI003D2C9086
MAAVRRLTLTRLISSSLFAPQAQPDGRSRRLSPGTGLAAAALLSLPLVAFAADSADSADSADEAELAELMAMLQEETALATHTRMNADYVPGMMTVLYAEDAQRFGLSTVQEALSLVAGFYITQANDGDTRTIVRGVGATLTGNNLKVLLNGVPMNRAVDASADWVFRLPLTQVERIEVIRGPGSALHGEFAFSGVVNVIPRSGSAVGARAGSDSARGVNAQLAQTIGNAGVQLNLVGWRRANSGLQTGIDNFYPNTGYAPGDVYDHEQGQVLNAAVELSGYQLALSQVYTERGPGYGENAALPSEEGVRQEQVTSISLSKDWALTESLTLGLSLSRQDTRLRDAAYLPIPAGVTPPGASAPIPLDQFRTDYSQDNSQRAALSLSGVLGAHTWLAELGSSQYEVEDAWRELQAIGLPAERGTDDQARVEPGARRQLNSLTLQDQWQLNEALEVTVGARYDDYDDWGSQTSPRLAAVWRAGDQHIVKLQYAEAFRPPTLQETYFGANTFSRPALGARDLREETVHSWEAAYIYRSAGQVLRTTLFSTEVRDLIEYYIKPGQAPLWRNRGDIDTYGAEVEWRRTLGRDWELRSNISYTHARDHLDEDGKLLGAVDWLANAGLTWHQSSRLEHSVRVRYVGQQEGWEVTVLSGDHTRRYDDYALVDYSLALSDVAGVQDLTLIAAVKNIGDEVYNTAPSPAQYPHGLPHGGRSGWLQLEYGF